MRVRFYIFAALSAVALIPIVFFGIWPHSKALQNEIEEVSDPQLKKELWQTGWEIFWQGGVDDPEYTVLRLMPAFAKGAYKESPFEFELNGRK